MSAGFAALAAAIVLGRRRSHEDGRVQAPANIPYVLLGTGMLWFGWFGFNAGSALSANGTAAMAFATTHFASATAMLTWLLFDVARGRRPSALGVCIGAVVGLVAITPAAGFVTIAHSIFIGFAASIVSNLAVYWKSQTTLDDTLDVFPCHGVGGIVGMILTGVLARDVGLLAGQTTTFVHHLYALAIVSAFTFFGSLALFKVTDWLLPIRVTPEQEAVGLDLSQHGEFMELEPMRQFGYSDSR
jgi:Amt family ammonium transporter